MDLRHGPYSIRFRSHATHLLIHYIAGEDRSLLAVGDEARTPPQIRPIWATPLLKLCYRDFREQLKQVSSHSDEDPSSVPAAEVPGDAIQTVTQHSNSDFPE